MNKIALIILTLFTLSSCDLLKKNNENSMFTYNISTFGKDYLDFPFGFEDSHIYSDINNNLFIYSRENKNIILFSESNEPRKVLEEKADAFIKNENYFCYGVTNGSGYDIYQINDNLEKVLIESVEGERYIGQYSRNIAINENYVVRTYFDNNNLIINKFNRETRENSKVSFKVEGMYANGRLTTASEDYIYVTYFSETANGLVLMVLDVNLDSLVASYIFEDFVNANSIFSRDNIIYICGSDRYYKLQFNPKESKISLLDSYYIDDNYDINSITLNDIFTGRFNGRYGIFKKVNDEIITLYVPNLEDNKLYSTSSIEYSNNKLYIICGNDLKVFENETLIETLPLYNDLNISTPVNIAINNNGQVVITNLYNQIGIIKDRQFRFENDPYYHGMYFGIDVLNNKDFIVRTTNNGDKIIKYDIENNEFKKLFDIPPITSGYGMDSEEVLVLQNGNLLINFGNYLQEYDMSGNLLVDGPVYEIVKNYGISSIDYSLKNDIIIASVHDDILLINPDDYSLKQIIPLKYQDHIKKISVDDNGIIYAKIYRENQIYKIELSF